MPRNAPRRSTPIGVPGPLRRLARDRARLFAVVLLAAVAFSASGVQSAAAASLAATLNANWRGAYDILVTAKGASVGKDGVLSPDSLATGKTMTLAEVARIRAVRGVKVAAPIGEVVVPRLGDSDITTNLPVASVSATAAPQAFRITAMYTTNDGLGRRVAFTQNTDVVIDNTPIPPLPAAQPCSVNGIPVDITRFPLICISQQDLGGFLRGSIFSTVEGSDGWQGGGTATAGVYPLDLNPAPQGMTRITLVDPVAERALLGKAGAFLDPLAAISPNSHTDKAKVDEWAKTDHSSYASDYRAQQAAREESSAQSTADESPLQRELAEENVDFDRANHLADDQASSASKATYVPVLTAQGGTAPLTLSLTVHSLGATTNSITQGAFPYLVTSAVGTKVGTSTADAAEVLNPFATQPVVVPWPDTPAAPSHDPLNHVSNSIESPGVVSGSQYTAVAGKDEALHATLTSTGYLTATPADETAVPDPFLVSSNGTLPGSESVYSPVKLLTSKAAKSEPIAVPVGSLSPTSLAKLQSPLSYVPLGAYESIGSTVTTSKGTRQLLPSVSGLGLVSPRTVAIASIASAAAWGQTSPVDAVRVRVAGIASYSTAAERKVVAVAQSIASRGFTATVVAGSSPTTVNVTVTGYAFGVPSIHDRQRVGSLGSVLQEWPALGAAARTGLAVSGASIAALGIALASSALLLGAVQFASVSRRRARAAVLRELGWARGGIQRWTGAEELPALFLIVGVGIIASALAGWSALALDVSACAIALVVLTSGAAIVFGSASNPRRRGGAMSPGRVGSVMRGRTVVRFGLRQVVLGRTSSIALVLATAVVAVAAAGLVAVIVHGRESAGASLLAGFALVQAAVPQLSLGIVAVAAGTLLAVLARQIDLRRRGPQWHALRAMGWTTRELRTSQRMESIALAIPGILIGASASGVLAAIVGTVPLWLPVTAGAAAAILVSAGVLLAGLKGRTL